MKRRIIIADAWPPTWIARRYVDAIPVSFTGFEEFDFFAHRYPYPGEYGQYRITEGTTGFHIGDSEESIEDAYFKAKQKLETKTHGELISASRSYRRILRAIRKKAVKK